MKTSMVSASHPDALATALSVLRRGGLIAFPTDTVYGLGALAFDREAVSRLYRAKGRPEEKAIPVLIADPADLTQVALDPPEMAHRLARRFWPGALTLVVRRRSELPDTVSATDTVGVRVPDHPVARQLLQAAGPLAVTSANRAGRPSLCTAEEVLAALRGRVELIVDGGRSPGGQPSTVVDCTREPPAVLREGPIRLDQILTVLGIPSGERRPRGRSS